MNVETKEGRAAFLQEFEQALIAELNRREIPYLKVATRPEDFVFPSTAFDVDIIPFQGSVHKFLTFSEWSWVAQELAAGKSANQLACEHAAKYLNDMLETNELWFKRGEQTDNLRAFQARLEQVRE